MVIKVSECVELLRLEKLRVNDLTIQAYPTYTLFSYVWNGWVGGVYASQHYVNTQKNIELVLRHFFLLIHVLSGIIQSHKILIMRHPLRVDH